METTTGSETPAAGVPEKKEHKRHLFARGITGDQANLLDSIAKLIGILGAIIGFFWGVYEFKLSSERDFEKAFYLEQIDIMKRTVNVVSTIAVQSPDSSDYKEAKIDLYKLTAGELYLFSDSTLEEKMERFYYDFEQFESRESMIRKSDLKDQSYEIAIHCKKIIEDLTRLNP